MQKSGKSWEIWHELCTILGSKGYLSGALIMSITLTEGLDVEGIYLGLPTKMAMTVLSRKSVGDSEKGPSPGLEGGAWEGGQVRFSRGGNIQ